MIRGHLDPPEHRRPALEPALPLINVVFLLLIFFMMAGQVAPDHEVEAPRSEAAEREEDPQLRTLTLDADGTLADDDGPLELTDIEDWFRSEPDAPLRLLAHGNLSLDALRPLLLELREAGADEVRLITRRPD